MRLVPATWLREWFLNVTGAQGLRPLSYSKSHVILIAFAIDTPDSLDNVTVKVRVGYRYLSLPSYHTLLVVD